MSLESQPLASILSTDAWLMGRAPDQEPAEQVFPFKILLPIHSPIHVCIEPLFCTRLRGIAENSGYSAALPELPELGRGHGQPNRQF